MRLTPVSSSSLRAAGYDERRKWLVIQFNSGLTYRYSDVPPVIFAELMEAASKGTFFNTRIRDHYSFVRL
jgi:lysyl-tRNA synthetase class 2